MGQDESKETLTLDTYIKNVKDQEIKGILLKLKNELRRQEVDNALIDSLLSSIEEKNSDIASEVLPLVRG